MSPDTIAALAETCRKHGISHLKTPDLEMRFVELAPEPQRKFPEDYVSGPSPEGPAITQDDIDLFEATGMVPVNLRELRARKPEDIDE